ncbi:hypothetical protein HDU97_001643 [Phlyctochytrium planicorne]|nr:hypothetical protein HDU97_001643 [Phlyctochytrium planicorne]
MVAVGVINVVAGAAAAAASALTSPSIDGSLPLSPNNKDIPNTNQDLPIDKLPYSSPDSTSALWSIIKFILLIHASVFCYWIYAVVKSWKVTGRY